MKYLAFMSISSIILALINYRFFNHYYEVYPEDLIYSDERQLKCIKEYLEEKENKEKIKRNKKEKKDGFHA